MTVHSPLFDIVTAPPAASRKWFVVFLLSAGLAADYLARLGLYSILPVLRRELIATDLALGLFTASFPWTYGILSPAAGYLGDRVPRRAVLILSIVGWSVATMLCALAGSAWQLVAARVLMATAQVAYMPAAQAAVADLHSTASRARASGLYQMGSYVGILMAGFPAAYVSTWLGWRTMLLLSGIVGLVLVPPLWRHLPHQTVGPVAGPADNGCISTRQAFSLLRKPSLQALMLVFSLASMTYWVLFTYLPLFIYEHYRLSLESAAFQSTFYLQFSAMVLMPLFGTFSDRWARRGARFRFLAFALTSLSGIPALLAIGVGHDIALLIAGLIIFGLVMAAGDASWLPMLCHVVLPHQRATTYGILNACGTLAGGLAAMATALVMKSVGLGLLIASLAAFFLLIAVVLLGIARWFLPRDLVVTGADT